MELLLAITALAVTAVSIVGSMITFLRDRRMRRFHQAQRLDKQRMKKTAILNPRGRQR